MAYQLTKEQKEELRRLTQRANRRIKSAFNFYAKEGRKAPPSVELVGVKYQKKSNWNTPKYPISRSTKFDNAKEYKERLKELEPFNTPESKGGRPNLTEYTSLQAMKLKRAMGTALNGENLYGLPDDLHDALMKRIDKMNAVEIADFWKVFERRGQRMTLSFSSGDSMEKALNEVFSEDLRPMVMNSIIDTFGTKLSKEEKQQIRNKYKHYNNASLINTLKKLRR